jgi:hypothetical protein
MSGGEEKEGLQVGSPVHRFIGLPTSWEMIGAMFRWTNDPDDPMARSAETVHPSK